MSDLPIARRPVWALQTFARQTIVAWLWNHSCVIPQVAISEHRRIASLGGNLRTRFVAEREGNLDP